MPSEIIVPGFTVIVLLFLVLISIISVIFAATTMFTNILKLGYEDLQKKTTRISIIELNVTYNGSVLEGELKIMNHGPLALYKFDACDLIIEYYSTNGSLKTMKLTYPLQWNITRVILVGDYWVEFKDHPVIESSEIGLLRLSTNIIDIDRSRPLKIVFVSHYGVSDSRWVILTD